MESAESTSSSDETETVDGREERSVPAGEKKRRRQRINSEKHRAKVKEFNAQGAKVFKEMARLLNQIYAVTEEGTCAPFENIQFDREPKFDRRIMIMKMVNRQLQQRYDKALVEQYFENLEKRRKEGRAVEEDAERDKESNVLCCAWCGEVQNLMLRPGCGSGKDGTCSRRVLRKRRKV